MDVFELLFKYPAETFSEGRLVFLSRVRGEVLLLILLAFAAVAWLLYRQALRGLVLVVLFFLLATPAWRR